MKNDPSFEPPGESMSGMSQNPNPTPNSLTNADFYFEATKQSLDDATYIVFDIETTGGNPEKNGLTEICALRFKNGAIEDSFYTMINPGIPIPPIVRRMTGISDNMVRNKPRIDSVMPDLVKFLGNSILVSHNTIGDIKFLRHFSKAVCGKQVDNFYICTHLLAEKLVPDSPDKSLKGLGKFLELPGVDFHRAMADAQVTLGLFRILLERLKARKITEVESAIRFQGDYESGMRLGWGVSSKKLRGLPASPGVFYLYNRNKELLFLSSATNLRRDVKRLLRFSQLPRPLLRQVLNTFDLEFKVCQNNLEAAIAQADDCFAVTPKFDPMQWHQRTISTIYLMKDHEGVRLSVGPIVANAFAAFGPISDRKDAKRLIDEIMQACPRNESGKPLSLPSEYASAVCDFFTGSLDKRKETLNKSLTSLSAKIFPSRQTKIKEELNFIRKLETIRLREPMQALHQTEGIVVLPANPQNDQMLKLYHIERALIQKESKTAKNIDQVLKTKKRLFWRSSKARPYSIKEASEANAILWWIHSSMNRREGKFLTTEP